MSELIVALDEPTFEQADAVVRLLAQRVQWYKVGYEAYYGYGKQILAMLQGMGKSIFLDLKLHDIPNVVGAAVKRLAASGAGFLTVHSAGGRAMLEAAAAARDSSNSAGARLRLLAVTVLTSLGVEECTEMGEDAPHRLVSIRSALAAEAGMDGAVCAVDEVPIVRSRTGDSFLIACPGIRPAGLAAGDQRRVATPTQAVMAGADYIVVGRPIAKASDPAAAAQAILDEVASARLLR